MTGKNKLNRIYTKKGVGVKLAKTFKCTTVTVSNALSGKNSSELAIKIRHTAINVYGGVEIQEKKLINN